MKRNLMLFLLSSVIFLHVLAGVGHAQAQSPWPVWVDMNVPIAPTPVKANGQSHLFYELHITNFDISTLELTRVEVLGEDANALPLASYQAEELVEMIARPGVPADLADKRLIDGGLRAVVYFHLVVDSPSPVPPALHHRLFFKSEDATDNGEARMVEGARVVVRRAAPLVINPPLQGESWFVANGLSNVSGHRRSLLLVDGKVRIPQRFAIDWARIGRDGQLFHDDPTRNENWYAYAADVFAVADGVVVGVQDGIAENVPFSEEFAVPITLETVGGNYILLDLGNRHFAFYGHLQPNSLRVKEGDHVQQGQVLALVGNSGDSSGPHLHFHVVNANSPLGAEGIPYAFTSFEMQGAVESLDILLGGEGWRPAPNGQADARHSEIPLQNAIVAFP